MKDSEVTSRAQLEHDAAATRRIAVEIPAIACRAVEISVAVDCQWCGRSVAVLAIKRVKNREGRRLGASDSG
jgi:hypothetical protein